MSIALISDIHGNLEALQAVLASASKQNAEKIYCLGDIVGYGPDPNECLKLVRESCEAVLVGNHDHAAIGKADVQYFNQYAKTAAFWTKEKLTKENIKYISSLPFTHQDGEMLMVHASPTNPSHWYYILSAYDALLEMQSFSQPLCFIGHSHVPVIYSDDQVFKGDHYHFDSEQKSLVNVGSVGQPRDGNYKPCYALYDSDSNILDYIRVDYEVQKTYSKIVKEGLPLFLAERLLKGY